MLISLVVLRLAPTLGIVLGSLMSFSGLVWLVSQGNPQQLLSHGMGKGELMMFAASTSYALYGVLTKRWAIPLPNWQSLYVQIVFGVLLLLPGFLLATDVSLNRHNIPLVLFLHETLHSYHFIGGGITLLGVFLAQRLRTPLRMKNKAKTDADPAA